MTIRNTLLIGISGIFLVMATCQIALVYYFKDKIEHEISENSNTLSRIVLHQASEEIKEKIIHLRTNSESHHAFEYDFKVIDSDKGEQLIDEIKKISPQSNTIKTVKVMEEVDSIIFDLTDKSSPKQLIKKTQTRSLIKNNSFAEFSQLILWTIVLSSLVAIGLAVMFAHKVTAPITHLIQGFTLLDKGKLGTQVAANAVGEMKTCISQFNEMSRKLLILNESEKKSEQYKQMAELGELSKGIAHALRNPIHTLGLTLEQFWQAEPDFREKLKNIAINKMVHINKNITALLSLSQTSVNRSKKIPLKAVIQDILLELSHEKVKIYLEQSQEVTVKGVESELRSILHTVIVNAVEASPTNDSINIKVIQSLNSIEVNVKDHGTGFDNKIINHIFEPHITSKADGAGMGLYLANRMVQLYYQGSITVINNEIQGATVSINLTANNENNK